MNPAQLAALIRFHLGELGARNAHHEFEHLARHLGRARIASNILPATGPVSVGGDRGRDFETFTTRIERPGSAGSTFAERSSGNDRLVFACSLQKTIEGKIRRDVKAIVANGDVDEIVYFCEPNLAVAKRHKLVAEAKAAGVSLQIFDGTAIAEWLAESDIFWIAQEYLHLPAEIFPAGELEEDYRTHRQRWDKRDPIPISRADFATIKAGLRKATFDIAARSDLLFWLAKMAAFLTDSTPRELARTAMYEIAVANLRGKGDLTPAAALIEDYFSDARLHTSVGEITDAVVLLTYCFGAYWLQQYQVDEAELHARRQTLAGLLATSLDAPGIGPGRRSGLLRMRGGLEFTPAGPGVAPDPEAAFAFWHEMLDVAEEAPLYPIEEFSDYLTQLVARLGELDDLLALAARTDELLAARAGSAAAGDKAVDRAFSLLERDEAGAAIRELHKAKAKWFSGEQLDGMLRILLLLSEQYLRLGLAYAAKNHALAAAYIARYDDRDGIGEILSGALLALLDAEDAAGNSLGFLQLFPVMLAIHAERDEMPFDFEQHPRLDENRGQLAALLGFLKRGNPDARAVVDRLPDEWPALIKDPIWEAADRPDAFWNEGSWADAWAGLEDAMLDRPFGDLGPTRSVRWQALGIDWACNFANDYQTTPHAEQMIAELQLAACALADRDLGIVPCAIIIELTVDAAATALLYTVPENGGCVAEITLPATDQGPDQSVDVIALFASILHCCSALVDDQIMKAFDRAIFEPIFVGRPYSELYREFVPSYLFAEEVRHAATALDPEREFTCRAGERVAWFDGPGPTYDPEGAKVDIEYRYQRIQGSLGFTLQRLVADPDACARLKQLHDEGRKDWEILGILSNIAMNHRVNARGDLSIEQWHEIAPTLIDHTEAFEDALAPTLFTRELIDLHGWTYLTAFLAGRELRAPACLKPEGLERFLAARYRLREDDIDHPDWFGWGETALTAPA
jgi:hypothetical protein